MFRSVTGRTLILVLFGVAVALSPPLAGSPVTLDAWLWPGMASITRLAPWRVVMGLTAATVLAAWAGLYLPRVAIAVRHPLRWALLIALLAGALLWHWRVLRWFGDLPRVDQQPLPVWTIEPAEPLGVLTYHYLAHAAPALGMQVSTIIAAATVAGGATAVAALFLWARLISDEWPLVFAMLVSSGWMIMLAGYVEKGTPKMMAVLCWYALATTVALRTRRAWPNFWSGLLLTLAILMHGAAAFIVPAQVWSVWRRAGWRRALSGIGGFALPLIPTALWARFWAVAPSGLPWYRAGDWVGNTTAPQFWLKSRCVSNCGYDFFSLWHFADIVNCLLILAPLATLCLPEALRRARSETQRWLMCAVLGGLVLAVMWFPVFGYRGDWDIFAMTPMLVSFLGIVVAQEQLSAPQFRSLAAAWIVANAGHTYAWWSMLRAFT